MSRDEIVKLVKSLCAEKQFMFVDDIYIYNSVLVLIVGEKCAEELDQLLTKHNLEHTTPTAIADGIGSYITIS